MPKILEYKNLDWMKGISSQANVPVGGLFQYIQGCDPFEPGYGGLAMPSLVPANQTLGTTPKFLLNYLDSVASASMLNILTNSNLYRVLKDSPYTVTDVTAQISANVAYPGTLISYNGHTIYKGKYIYVTGTNAAVSYQIQANSLRVASGSDVNIGLAVQPTGTSYFNTNFGNFTFRFCQGADGNLYFNLPEGVGEITNVTGTSGNTNAAITTGKIDPGFIVRDLINDGRYLVILADNNGTNDSDKVDGDFQSKIYFWDMVQTDGNGRIVANTIWDIKDPYLIGGRFMENGVYFFGHNGFYVCNVATSPKLIRSYPSTVSTGVYGRPTNAYQIANSKGSIYWVDGTDTINGYVYAYGNPVTGQQKIFYIPYTQNGSIYQHTCLASIGNQFVSGTVQPGLFFFNVGSTRGHVVVKSLDTNTIQPYRFDYIKVSLGTPMVAGQSLQVIATSAGGTNTLSSEVKSYATNNAKQTYLFRRTIVQSNQAEKFEDIAVTVNSNGAPIQRVTVYATPLEDANEDL
jgi:hypothetical protein